jgi:hypothetical protein
MEEERGVYNTGVRASLSLSRSLALVSCQSANDRTRARDAKCLFLPCMHPATDKAVDATRHRGSPLISLSLGSPAEERVPCSNPF